MTKFYRLCTGFELLKNMNVSADPQAVYSKDKNILISIINKNCSYSLEHWIENSENTTFELYNWHQLSDIIDLNDIPDLITILRDPISRASSAIYMLCEEYKCYGLSLSYENFTNLEFSIDPHLMPQTMFVPIEMNDQNVSEIDVNFDYNNLKYRYASGWCDYLKNYNIVKRLTKNHRFFYMYPGKNLTADLGKYLNEPDLMQWWSNSADHRHHSKKLPEHYLKYLKNIYSEDYKLINSVKFENI